MDDPALRDRLAKARVDWKAANGIWSALAPVFLGQFASGSEMTRLYLYGGLFHSDLDLSQVWDCLGPDQQQFIEYQVRQYEGRVREVCIELKKVIDEAAEAGVLRGEPLERLESRPSSTTKWDVNPRS